MARQTKDGIKVTYLLDREVAEALETFCAETGRTKTKVVELAVKEFVKNHSGKE